MARMIAEVYDALKSAGAEDDRARRHCHGRHGGVMVDIRQRLRVVEWAIGANTVKLIGLVLKLIVFSS